MHAAATSVAAMAHPLPASSSSICLNYGQARLQNPLCLPRFRRIRRPLKSAHGELQTSEPTTAMTASTSITTHRVTVHDRERGVVNEFLVPEGYALLCVGFPSSDIEVETQDEDEVCWLQFGWYFAQGPVERDDYALELAMGDE